MAKIAGMDMIPPGTKVVLGPGGKSFLQKKSRRRRRFKTSLATRKKIAASARKFKLPVLTVGAQIPWMAKFKEVYDFNSQGTLGVWNGLRRGAEQVLLPAFTGLHIFSNGSTNWSFKNMSLGLLPNLMVMGVKKSGIFRGANRALAKSRIPVRLS